MMSGEPETVKVPKPENDYATFWMMETLTGACAETDDIVAESPEYDFFAHMIRIEVSQESLEFFKRAEIRSSGRVVYTILGKTWDKCFDGIKFIDFECEVGREKQDERRRDWLLKDGFNSLDRLLELVRSSTWSYEPVPCHDHCAVPMCAESLCCVHPEKGTSHAFLAVDSENDYRLCGRCYAALLEISREQA